MNMRQHRRFVQTKVRFIARRAIITYRQREQWDKLWEDIGKKQAVRQLVEPDPVEEASAEYVVARVSTGEVVGTFGCREDAVALIDKHARQKKAKLALV